MHIVLRDPKDNATGIICVDREAGTSIVLLADIDELDQLVAIAKAQTVPEIQMAVPAELVPDLQARGWSLQTNLRMMVKR